MPSEPYQLLSTDRRSLGGQLPETKYLQILKAQSQKLKSKTNFRHIQKLLTDLRDKLAMQSSNGDSHLFQATHDEQLDAINIHQRRTSILQSGQ